MDNLEEMDKFLQRYSFPRLNQKEIENMTRPIQVLKFKNLKCDFKISKNKSPGPHSFTGEFHQTFRELTPRLLKLFQKTAEEGILPNSFYEATTTLIPKPDKDTTHKKRKLQVNITDEYRCKNPQQNISKLNPTIY